MTKANKNTGTDYAKLKHLLPKGYRQRISKETGASMSTVDAVLRGHRKDTKGILVAAYRIAEEVSLELHNNASELAKLKKNLHL